MPVTFSKGQPQEFVATRDFGLNWEDRNIKSVKVRSGEVVLYDGEQATYTKGTGEQIIGRCPSLKSVINTMGWLEPKNSVVGSASGGPDTPQPMNMKNEPTIPMSDNDFDGRRGGNFDTFAHKSESIHVATVGHGKVIREKDLVVREIPDIKRMTEKTAASGEKLEIAGEQFEVNSRLIVNSSTSGNKQAKRSPQIIQADEMGADTTLPMTTKRAASMEPKKKKSFVIDEKTPRTIGEDMTKAEVERITKVVVADDTQDAKVVKPIKPIATSIEVEGITMKKYANSPTASTVASKDLNVTAKVSAGSEAVVDVQSAGTVVATMGTKKVSADVAAKRAAARKAASVLTQTQIEKEHGIVKEVIPAPVVEDSSNPTDAFLSMLPDNWSKMHWVQKEKFVKEQTNAAFIQFILSVESIKAVQNACTERLNELGQTTVS
jgi:hypothetical protein